MNILIVLPDLNYRGGERYFSNLSKGLLSLGHKVFIVAGRVGNNPKVFSKGIAVIKPPLFFNKLFQNNVIFFFLSSSLTFINTLVLARKADVIYSSEHILGLWPACFAAALFKKKVVVTFFGGFEKPPSPSLSNLIPYLLFLLTKFFSSQAAYAVTLTEQHKLGIEKWFSIKHVSKVMMGVDTDDFITANPNLIIKRHNLKGKTVLLVVAALSKHRRPDMAIQVLQYIKKSHPDAVLILLGGGESEYIEELKSLADSLGIHKDVIFTGVVSEEDLSSYYAIADVVLHTSYIIGYTVLEAALMKKMPIYLSDAQPFGHVYKKWGIGIAVYHDTPSAYAKAVIGYLQNKDTYRINLAQSYGKVLKQCSLKQFSRETLDVFMQSQNRL